MTTINGKVNLSKGPLSKKIPAKKERIVHFYILLDRSGSMESMKSDVIGGYNTFIQEQKDIKGRAKVTLVQFDSQDPQEMLLEASSLRHILPLSASTFIPRGGTPLLDASAKLIEKALGRQAARSAQGRSEEEIVFLTITDGQENQSVSTSLSDVRNLVETGKEQGWSFVFLGVGLDAYADARVMGYADESVQEWKANGDSAKIMWGSVSRAASALRRDVADNVQFDKQAFFRGIKEVEQAYDSEDTK